MGKGRKVEVRTTGRGTYGTSGSGKAPAKKYKGGSKIKVGGTAGKVSTESTGNKKDTSSTTETTTSRETEVKIEDVDNYSVATASTTEYTNPHTPTAKRKSTKKPVTVYDKKPPVESKETKKDETKEDKGEVKIADAVISAGVKVYDAPDIAASYKKGKEAFGNIPILSQLAGLGYGLVTLVKNYGMVGNRIHKIEAPKIPEYKGEVKDWMKESFSAGDVIIVEGKWAEVIKIDSVKLEYRFVNETQTRTTDVTDALIRQNAAELPLDAIRPTVNGLSGPRLDKSMHRIDQYITVAVVDGKYYCVDGHHRLLYMSAAKMPKVRVRYVHMTKAELKKRLKKGHGTRYEVPENLGGLKVDPSRTDVPTRVERTRSEPTPDTRSVEGHADYHGVEKTRNERELNSFVEYYTGNEMKSLTDLAKSSNPVISKAATQFRGRVLLIQQWVRAYRKLEGMNPSDRHKAEQALITEIRNSMSVLEKVDPVFCQNLSIALKLDHQVSATGSHQKGERELIDNFYTTMNGVVKNELKNSPYNMMEQRYGEVMSAEKTRLNSVRQILNVLVLHSGSSIHYKDREGNFTDMAPYMKRKSEADASTAQVNSSSNSTGVKTKVDPDATHVEPSRQQGTPSGPVVIDYNLVPRGKVYGLDITTPQTVLGWTRVQVAVRNELSLGQQLELYRYLSVEAGWKSDQLSKMFGAKWMQMHTAKSSGSKDSTTNPVTSTKADKELVDKFIDSTHQPYYLDVVDRYFTPDKEPVTKLASEMGIPKFALILKSTTNNPAARENFDVLLQKATSTKAEAAHVRDFLKTASVDQILLLVTNTSRTAGRSGVVSYLSNHGYLDILSGDPASHVSRIEGIKDVPTRDLLLALCAHREFQLRKDHPYRQNAEGLDLLHRFGIDPHEHATFPWNSKDTMNRASLYFRVKAEKRNINTIFAKAAPGKEGAAKALVDKMWNLIMTQDVKDTKLPFTPHGWQHTLDVVKLQRDIYNSSPALRDALIKQFGSEAKALAVMDAVALMHDVGYGMLKPGESKGKHAIHSGEAFKSQLAKDFKELYDLTDKQVEDIFLAIQRHGADKYGKPGYMAASVQNNPLLMIIRLADNLDSSIKRLRSAQTHPLFLEAIKTMYALKANGQFTSGDKATQKSMLDKIRRDYALKFGSEMAPNDAKLANELLREMNQESWPHFKGAERVTDVKLSVENGQLVVEFRILGSHKEGTVTEKDNLQVEGSQYQLWRAYESAKSLDYNGKPIIFRYKEMSEADHHNLEPAAVIGDNKVYHPDKKQAN